MSANIYWQVTKGKSLDVHAPSSFIATFERAFGRRPWDLGPDDVPTLKGIVAASPMHDGKAWQDLLEAIETFGCVRVWAEW